MKKVAIIGSGIGGTASAYYLNNSGFDVTVFEANNYFGGHTNTIDVNLDGEKFPVDTGFLVHNDKTYPNLIRFFKELEIGNHASEMTFSVDHVPDNIVWAGTNIMSLFAQKKNLFSVNFYSFIREILRFNKNSDKYLEQTKENVSISLGELLEEHNYSARFAHWYLLPMGGCIWSTPTKEMLDFPAYTFLKFCKNHGLLQIFNRPQWKTVKDGCRTYVKKALNNIDKKYLNSPITKVESKDNKCLVYVNDAIHEFDYVLFATHPPQTLKILDNPNTLVQLVLASFTYQKNTAVLHWDKSVLPKQESAWAAWNYKLKRNNNFEQAVSVSYLINDLQPLPVTKPIIVSLNPLDDIDSEKIIKKINYEHPLFDDKVVGAQSKVSEIQGIGGIYYAGAWCRYGFHEDGILSAKLAVNEILRKHNLKTVEVYD